MAKLFELVLHHYTTYPLMQAEDFHKLLFQATRGPVHSLRHLEKAKEYFFKEWKETSITEDNIPCFENISLYSPLFRVHFGPLKKKGIQPELLWEFFFKTSETFVENCSHYETAMREFLQISKNSPLSYVEKDFGILWEKSKEDSLYVPTHSEVYRNAYQPHYRLVSGKYLLEIIPYEGL
jgi:hypothetical protein